MIFLSYSTTLSFVLKDFKSFSSLSDFGSWFHSKGAANGKALSPSVLFDLKVGGANKTSSLERRLYGDFFLIVHVLPCKSSIKFCI